MAYHRAPQHDLPEVVPETRDYHPQTSYGKPLLYDSFYDQEQHRSPPGHVFPTDVPRQREVVSDTRSYHLLPEVVSDTRNHAHPQPPTHYRKPVLYGSSDGQELQLSTPGQGFPQDVTGRPLPNYKPPSLRWAFLAVIITVILGYTALAEYAIQTLPGVSGRDVISDLADLNRQLYSSPSGAVSMPDIPPAAHTTSESTPNVRARHPQEGGTDSPTIGAGEGLAADPADDAADSGDVSKPDTPTADTDPDTPDDPAGGDTVTATLPADSYVTLETTISVVVTPVNTPTLIDGVSTTIVSSSTLHDVISTVHPDPTFVPADIHTLTDENGNPTTVTSTPKPFSTQTVLTTTDSQGRPITITTDILATPTTTVLTDSNDTPTATQTLYPSAPTPSSRVVVFSLKKRDYFTGYFLPTILSSLLAIPVRMIDINAQLYYPFHELTQPRGATAPDSLLLRTGGLFGIGTALRALRGRKLLLSLSSLLVLCSAVLIPLSSEAVSLKLYNVDGACTSTDLTGCVMALSVFSVPARATVALLAFMVVLICGIIFCLRRWVSGVAGDPWSAAAVAALCGSEDVREVIAALPRGTGAVGHKRMVEGLEGRRFRLGYFWGEGRPEYGILMEEPGPTVPHGDWFVEKKSGRSANRVPFMMLSVTGRALFSLFIMGLLVLILYYNNTGGDSPFEHFMSQQTFGVRFLFTSFGVIVGLFWSSLFDGIAIMSPYLLLSKRPQPARVILLSPPTNAFTGLFSAIRRRDPLLAAVALTTILSEFLPILLNNVPFRVTQTWITHRICTWTAVGVLAFMLLVVLGTFWVRWPDMPVDPSTLAGAMYYVADSRAVECLSGVSVQEGKERERRVMRVGGKYKFGEVWGVRGGRRVGVDFVGGFGS